MEQMKEADEVKLEIAEDTSEWIFFSFFRFLSFQALTIQMALKCSFSGKRKWEFVCLVSYRQGWNGTSVSGAEKRF